MNCRSAIVLRVLKSGMSALAMGCLLAFGLLLRAAAEPPTFAIVDKQKFVFDTVQGTVSRTLKIGSKGGNIAANWSANVLHITAPDGDSLGSDGNSLDGAVSIKSAAFQTPLTPQGADLNLAIQTDKLKKQGTYTVSLVVAGNTTDEKPQPIAQWLQFQMERPAATLDLQGISPMKVVVTRPLSVFGGTSKFEPVHVLLRDTGVNSGRLIAPTVEATALKDTDGVAAEGFQLKADHTSNFNKVTLALEGKPPHVGSYAGQWIVKSDSLAANQTMEVNVIVRDGWIVPLAVIGLGVGLSSLIQHLTGRVRPTQELLLKISLLRHEADDLGRRLFANRGEDAGLRNQQDNISRRLLNAEDALRGNDLTTAREAIGEAQTLLLTLNQDTQTLVGTVQAALNEAARTLNRVTNRIPAGDPDVAKRDNLETALNKARQLLEQESFLAARTEMEAIKSDIEDLGRKYRPAAGLENLSMEELIVPQGNSWLSGASARLNAASKETPQTGRQRIIDYIRSVDFALLLFAGIIAVLTGFLALYAKAQTPFGTMADYVGALLWGFGVDSAVRGLAPLLAALGARVTR